MTTLSRRFSRQKIRRSGGRHILRRSLTRPASITSVTSHLVGSFQMGIHYEGYLWDHLRSPSRITIQRFRHELILHPEVFILADDHSRDRIPGAPLWPYRPYSVARFHPQVLLQSLEFLPEDIYVFDSSVSWTLALTHENDGRRRICCSVGIDK